MLWMPFLLPNHVRLLKAACRWFTATADVNDELDVGNGGMIGKGS